MPRVSVRSHTGCHAQGGSGGVSELDVPGWGGDAPAAPSGELPLPGLEYAECSMQNDWGFSIACQELECLHIFFSFVHRMAKRNRKL